MKKLSIIYESKDFLVIDKESGILVHKVPRVESKEKTIVDILVEKYPEIKSVGDRPEERPGIVHRLDRETSGVMIIARTQKFFDYLKNLFQEGKINKSYLAIVHDHPPNQGLIDKPIGLKSGSIKRSTRAKKMRMVKPAVTEFKTIKRFDYGGEKYALLKVFPKTGRTHQIRVHLSVLGFPVVGDKLYGRKRSQRAFKRHLLHAESIEFSLISGERVRFDAIQPSDFGHFLNKENPQKN